jgi:hypothetical protein
MKIENKKYTKRITKKRVRVGVRPCRGWDLHWAFPALY